MPTDTQDPAAISPAPSAGLPTADDASTHLVHRLSTRWDDLIATICSINFYIELAMVLVALAAAALVAKWLRKRITHKLETAPPKFIDAELLTKPLLLLGPVLAMCFLWPIQIIAILSDIGGDVTAGVLQLCYAYLLSKCVLLVVKSRPVAFCLVAALVVNAGLHVMKIAKSTFSYLDSLAFDIGKYHFSVLHLLHAFVIFVVVFWGAGLLSRTLESYLRRSTALSHNGRELTVKFFRLFIYLMAFMVTLSAVGIDLTALAVFSGALGVGVGLGLQKLTGNFVSGVTMLMEKSIKIGDIIEVGGNTGWVRQLNIRYALLETFDGKEVLIPNEELVSTRVINWTLTTTLARIAINMSIDTGSDAEKAHELLLEAAREHPSCLKDPAPTCWLKEVTGNGINFELNFWIADVKEGRNGPQSDVLFTILKKFSQAGITLAKPN